MRCAWAARAANTECCAATIGCIATGALVVFAFWAPIVGPREFLDGYDDPGNFGENLYTQNCSLSKENIVRIFTEGVILNVYEPISLLFRLFVCEAGGSIVNALHVIRINVVLHLVNTALSACVAVEILRRLCPRTSSTQQIVCSIFAAALVAVHPLRTEVVAWASCQPYLIAGTFTLLSVCAHLVRDRAGTSAGLRGGLRIISIACFVLGVFSKAVTLSVPSFIVALDAHKFALAGTSSSTRPRNVSLVDAFTCSIRRCTAWAFVAFVSCFVVVRQTYVRASSEDSKTLSTQSLVSRFRKGAFGALFYLRKTLVPSDLSLRYAPSYAEPYEMNIALLLVVVVTIALLVLASGRRVAAKEGALLWISYLAMLSPTFLSEHCSMLAADRYVYLPSILLLAPTIAIFLARLWSAYEQRRFVLMIASLSMCLALACRTNEYTKTWGSEELLWKQWIDVNPKDPGLHVNLGAYYFANERFGDAAAFLRSSRTLVPDDANVHKQYASALLVLGNAPGALEALKDAAQNAPSIEHTFAELKQSLLRATEDHARAHDVYVRFEGTLGKRKGPLLAECDSLRRLGRLVDAEMVCRRAARLDRNSPTDLDSFQMTTMALLLLNQMERRVDVPISIPFARPPMIESSVISENPSRFVSLTLDRRRRAHQERATRIPAFEQIDDHEYALPARSAPRIEEARKVIEDAIRSAEARLDTSLITVFAIGLRSIGAIVDADAALRRAARIGCEASRSHSLGTSQRSGRHVIVRVQSTQEDTALSDCYAKLAHAFADFERHLEASQYYDSAARATSNVSDVGHHVFNAGTMLGEMREWDMAAEYFEEALRYRPDLVEAHCYLGGIVYNQLSAASAGFADERTRIDTGLGHFKNCLDALPSKRTVYAPFYKILLGWRDKGGK
eukprot:g2889.t1